MTEDRYVSVSIGEDRIARIKFDDPSRSVNTMTNAFRDELTEVLDQLESARGDDPKSLRGVIVSSGKPTFFAGGDLGWFVRADKGDTGELFEFATACKRQLRRLESLGVPVAALLGGSALGGGFEIALACHRRVMLDAPGVKVGLPEVTLGLLPGGGGVVRSVRLLGVQRALNEVLLSGKTFGAIAALESGLVDEIVSDQADLEPAALRWIESTDVTQAIWDRQDYSMPGGSITLNQQPRGTLPRELSSLAPQLYRRLRGGPDAAPRSIVCAAVEGAQLDFDNASVVESRYFADLASGQQSTNIIQGTFYDVQTVRSGATRPDGFPVFKPAKIAVLGAGMMGAGIAHACAVAGWDVVLTDVSVEQAERGKQFTVSRVGKACDRGDITAEQAQQTVERVTATSDMAMVAGADVVIETVFEDPGLKQSVTREAAALAKPEALLCSNTSTIPISILAGGTDRPEDFIGLHFFSPVDRMDLVEIIVGERTSDRALAQAIDLVKAMRKLPIVVNDGRGFFTSRVILQRLVEAAAMIGEGVAPASIEVASLQAGYPVGTLALLDEVTLRLPLKIRGQFREAAAAESIPFAEHPGDAVLTAMVNDFGRPGRADGAGFYDYTDGQRAGLWAGLDKFRAADAVPVPLEDLRDRLLFAEALDSVRCVEAGVLRSVADANVGSILGIGFPQWTGGVLQFVTGHPGGIQGFVQRAHELAAAYGDRFAPPELLLSDEASRLIRAS